MKFSITRVLTTFIFAVVSFPLVFVFFQNCSPVRFATMSSNDALSAVPACDPSSFGSQPYTTADGSGACVCTAGQEVCSLTTCTDPSLKLVGGVCAGPAATTLAVLINQQSSISLLPSTASVDLDIVATGPIHSLQSDLSTITRVAGSCAASTLSPGDLSLSQGQLVLGDQSFIYSSALAGQIKGCTWRVTAVADNGKSASADFLALLCAKGSANPVPACTTADGQAGHSVCADDGLSYNCIANAPVNCTFNSSVVQDGGSVTAYPTSSVPYGQTCVAQTRTCQAGVLSGSAGFTRCSVLPGASCTFNGQTVADGAQVRGYLSASVAYGSTCQAGQLTCHNGQLIGAYTSPSCSEQGNPNCNVNGSALNNGASLTVFQASHVSYGSSCVSQTLACSDGVVTGARGSNTYYTNLSCSVDPAANCNFNGTVVASGSTITAYQDSVVNIGSSCVSQTRTCTNGQLDGSFAFSGCSVRVPNSCVFQGQTIASGQSVVAYTAPTVGYGLSCDQVAQTRTCNDGTLSGSATNPSCTVSPPAPCIYNGQPIANGAVVTAYNSQQVPNGSSCVSETVTCNNGSLPLDAGYTYATCSVTAARVPLCYDREVIEQAGHVPPCVGEDLVFWTLSSCQAYQGHGCSATACSPEYDAEVCGTPPL